jgi:hypothetical protein
MSRIIYLLLLLFFPLTHNGQDLEIEWGQEFRKKGLGLVDQKMIGHTNQFYYVLNRQKKEKELFQYDFDHKKIKVTPVVFKYEGHKIGIKQIINTASNNFLIGSSENRNKKLADIHISKLNENGNAEKDMKHLFSYDFERNDFLFADYNRKQDAIGISISQDSSKVLFAYVNSSREGRNAIENEIYQLLVFDDEMNKLWEKEVAFPYAEKQITVKQFEITNSGEVYILAKVKGKKKTKDPLYRSGYYFFKVTHAGDAQTIKITPKDVFPTQAFFRHLKNGDIYVGGFYAKKDKQRNQHNDGVFLVKYSQNLEAEKMSIHPWKKEFLDQLDEEYDLFIGKTFFNNLSIGNAIIDYSAQSITFVSERRYTKSVKKQNMDHTYWTYHYSNSLIIPSFSFDGNLRWVSYVQKDFKIRDKERASSSYVLGYKNGNIYLIFNDNKTFKETQAMKIKRKDWTANFTEIVRINSKGEIDLKELFLTSKDIGGLFFRPRFSKFIHNDKFLLQCTSNKKSRFGIFALP